MMSVQQIESEPARVGDADASAVRDNSFDWMRVVSWLALTAAAGLLLGPLLDEYRRQLWSAEHYQFFPMLLAAVAWLAWRRYQTLPVLATRPASAAWRTVLWGAALLLATGAAVAASPLAAAIATLALILAGLYEWGGKTTLRHFLPVWTVLLLLIRIPFGWDQKMIVALQRAAASWASGTLDLLHIRHLADGVVIRLPERDFFIEEACSGVHSLFATVAFLAVFAVVTRRSPLRFSLLFVASVFWVLVANALRILAVVILSTRYNLPVLDGAGHETIGVIVFAFVIGLVLSTDRLFLFVLPQREAFPGEKARAPSAVPAKERTSRSRIAWTPALVAVALVGVAVGLPMIPANATPTRETPYASSEGLMPIGEEALPTTWNGWERAGFQVREREKDDLAGEISRIWYYRKGRLQVSVSIDGPFDSWHNTEVCYDALGYTTQSCDDHDVKIGRPSAGAFTELAITGAGGEHGYVLFMAYSEAGDPLRPPATRNASVARLVSVWRDRFSGRAEAPLTGRVYQVQLFAQSGLNFTASERDEMHQLFHAMRNQIAEATAAHRAAVSATKQDPGAGETT